MKHILIVTTLVGSVAACGHSDEELAAALAQQKSDLMAANQSQVDKMKSQHDQLISDREKMIGGLEAEVAKLGGDLKVVRTEIASRTAELAGTKAELSGTKAELTASTEEVEKLRRLREQAEKEAAQFRALATRLKSMIDAGQLEVVMRDGRINLKLPD
ncbi:MAG: hypothetical protein AAFN74_17370, partial [Myxococcota bacterium]